VETQTFLGPKSFSTGTAWDIGGEIREEAVPPPARRGTPAKSSFFWPKKFATNPLTILDGLGIHRALTLDTGL
jgi:hypothetical protein